MTCYSCGGPLPEGRSVTCSPDCHEAFVAFCEATYGTHKNIARTGTGETFRVPTRDIIEKGITEQDLDQYPRSL